MVRRVVVTGLGCVTPLGTGVQKTWDALCRGTPGIEKIARFDPGRLETQIAGEVKDFEAESFIPKKDTKRMDLFTQYAVACAVMALDDAGFRVTADNAGRVGVIVGVGLGGLPTLEKYHRILLDEGPDRVSPFFIPMLIGNMAAGQVSIRFGTKGPNICTTTACSSGSHAVGDSFRIIQRGDADLMIAGGAESTITPLAIAGFNSMKALSKRNNEPHRASRPFDRDRDGFVMAEGAGIVILEALDHARARKARIYAEIIGYGANSDAYHMATPSPEGEGAARCMSLTLADAGVSPEAVDYINAHGTSTYYNDLYETQAIKKVFGAHAKKVCVSSTKSMTGHLLGAAGGVEAVISVLAIHHGIVPPTVNYDIPDPDCDLDYVPNTARTKAVDVALSNSFGFGSTNACLLFKKFVG